MSSWHCSYYCCFQVITNYGATDPSPACLCVFRRARTHGGNALVSAECAAQCHGAGHLHNDARWSLVRNDIKTTVMYCPPGSGRRLILSCDLEINPFCEQGASCSNIQCLRILVLIFSHARIMCCLQICQQSDNA